MTINFDKFNRDYSLYLPSISSMYCKYVSDYYTLPNDGPRKGKLPSFLENGFDSLNFLDEEKGLFYYPKALYSAGHAFLDLEKSDRNESMVQKRDRNKTFILGDSGGYQVATGILNFDWDNIYSKSANESRQKILDWLEHTADLAMLFDFPTATVNNKKASLSTFRECLEGSLENFNYFMKNRKGNTKYLNIIQGRTWDETETWFNEIKDFPFEGWAFGGVTMMDFEMILRLFVILRDGKYFEENSNGDMRSWVHFLGQSRMTASCAFTTMQRIMREQIDPNFVISYDSASAFIATAMGKVYTRDVFDNKKFSYIMDSMFDDKSLVGSDKPFPFDSIIGNMMNMGDICVKDESYDNKTSWDSFSYVLIMMHNVERHIKAIQMANKIYDLPIRPGQSLMPSTLAEFKDVCTDVFNSENPMKIINENRKLLNNLAGRKTGDGIPPKLEVLNNLFDVEVSTMSADDFDLENLGEEVLDDIDQDAEVKNG